MEFTIDLALLGWVALIAGALIFGVVTQFIGEAKVGLEWIVSAIAFFVGALFASEFIVAWQTFAPVWEGLAIVPALIGGLVVGIVAEVITRLATGGTYLHHPASV